MLSQGYDPYQAQDEYGGTGKYPQDYGGDDRPQRNTHKKKQMPSEPSPHVIFLGLDPDFTEADVRVFLTYRTRNDSDEL